jgi:UDP-N-acetylmuramate dehydrogenase
MSLWTGFEKVVRFGEPLAMHTWFQIGGPAQYFAEPSNLDELVGLVRRCREQDVPMRVLGRGSNLLVRDEGVPGLILRLSHPAFGEIQVGGDSIRAGAGASLGRVVTTAAHQGLAGLESLVAIPGTLGGALHGNVSAHSGNIGQWTEQVTALIASGDVVVREREELNFTHRASNIDGPVLLSAVFSLEPDDPRELAKRLQKQWIVRKATQPMGHQCAGCAFKSPRGKSAGDMIEKAGLKGARIGGAVVSDRHADFIVAEPEATSSDILRLIELIRSQVRDRLGVDLEVELEIW